jgi:electron transfer flavoprotein alpha subunit
MKIVVPVKQVAVLDDEFELLDDGTGVDPDFLDFELNEWDQFSLEAALQLRDTAGDGDVVAVTVGGDDAQEGLLSALAKGADRGVPVRDDELEGADALAVARVLAAVVEPESPDLILCGVQSSDSVSSATRIALAGPRPAARRGGEETRAGRRERDRQPRARGCPDLGRVDGGGGAVDRQGAARLMPGVLVIAEARQGELRDATFELIGAALALKETMGATVSVAIVDAGPGSYTDALGADGVDEVLTVVAPVAQLEAHVAGRALQELIEAERPALVLAAHSIDALGYAPAVATALHLGFATDVVGVSWEGGPVATRGAHGGKLVDELDFPGWESTLLLLRARAFSPTGAGAGSAPVRDVAIDLSGVARTEHLGYLEVTAGDVDITKSAFLLFVGRGVEDKDNVARFEKLAGRFGATLSVSRPLVDAGWMPSDRQVGQSGKTVKPRVYLALGISGAVQHLAGMRAADTIIAVNTDPEAPIFGVAHYGAVIDMFELADELDRELAGG